MEKNLINNVTLGADPEMFLFSKKTGLPVPVCGLVGGTKYIPLPINDRGHFVQEDNVMIEYCIPPCKTINEFIDNIKFAKDFINDNILARLGLESKCVASTRFKYDDLQSDQALLFGCDPDYNAWTYDQNDVAHADPLLRSAGGHIHIGYDRPDAEVSINLIRAMDLFLGVPSILKDLDTERRKLYGKAGAYRLKDYGVEYRVLSTFWTDKEEDMIWVWEGTMRAIDFINNGGIITNPKDIVACINNVDKDMAIEIMDDYHIEIPGLIETV